MAGGQKAMNDLQSRQAVENSLRNFRSLPLATAAVGLLESLGYKSQKRFPLKPNTAKAFVSTFSQGKILSGEQALLSDWQSVDLLFQLTDEEIRGGANQQFLFESKGKFNGAAMESYLFFAIALRKPYYTRTQLSGITRAVNRLFPMPVMLLFQHGETLTLAIINRRLHKRDESKDVLEKVTLIKDINFARPHRAHVEILCDLGLEALYEKHHFTNFPGLHEAWQKTLDISELNKRFFQEVANWYFWAVGHTKFPKPKDVKDTDAYQAQSVIRLITRLIFCWFLKEKGFIPPGVFDEKKIAELLNEGKPKSTTYYKAILQNLFFATLSQEQGKRAFRRDGQNFMAHTLYRYRGLFKNPEGAISLFSSVPFLNGGLFECLDKSRGTKEKPVYIRIDGFSDHPDNLLSVPDYLFFGDEVEIDLNSVYDTRGKRYRVRGIIHTLDRYKFTVEENTPIDEEVALDPELLGKVFENLLAQYNPETGTTARKQTGSFYTPREVVDFMVDQALIASLLTKLNDGQQADIADLEPRLRQLLAYDNKPHQFTFGEVNRLIQAIDGLKVLDPACGSGAFPMGALQKLVFILGRLDPENALWKAKQISKAGEIPDATVREHVTADIEQAFNRNELNYGRKLYLIENCIFGVDIQSIACQIAKLRFFISLVVDQRIDDKAPNFGVRPLPNLETNIVAADSLMDIERPAQGILRNAFGAHEE
jgi:hypothetical protein